MANILARLFTQNQSAAFLRVAEPVIKAAHVHEEAFKTLSQEDLKKRLLDVQERSSGDVKNIEDIAEVFALVREASGRTLGERHYDVQLIGGLALAYGKIAEMRTGEGKTLVATLAATLRALAKKGVHIVTVNDYLARRDGAWMGQVYDYLGLSVGVVTSSGSYVYDAAHTSTEEDAARDETGSFRVFYDFLRPVEKKDAYAADIIYATNNELGFDYLRDNTSYTLDQQSGSRRHFAIIDEIDSILIDEARTPLIISGPAENAEEWYDRFAKIAETFVAEEDYVVDEKQKAVQLTEAGIHKAETALNIENLYTEGGVKLAHHLETAVRAKALFHPDKEYVIKDGQILIVDEFTGRIQSGRRWSEGLHQAIEAKEGVTIQRETRTYASITFQNYFRMYESLSGMTGTGLSSEEEFHSVYGLEVIVVPTNRPVARKDENDLIFQNARGKYQALARDVKELYDRGQPVLIGTVSIEDNEVVSHFLKEAHVPHEVLNAKNHEREGEIIAQAGRKNRVTVATNLAGRGVDIKLGGAPVLEEERQDVLALGGLAVLGTERHEARRIDNQLRGRSGRQGDPGYTRFYVSLEDKLMRVFASDAIKSVMGTFKIPEDEAIESGMITKALETAQTRIEGFNFDSRKQVLAYDDVLNTQRLAMYARRQKVLAGTTEDIESVVLSFLGEDEGALKIYEQKKTEFGPASVLEILRRTILQVTDTLWLEQLETMDYIRRSVSLRAYGQRDPLIEYRKEGLIRFQEMEATIAETIKEAITHVNPVQEAEQARVQAEQARIREALVTNSSETGAEAPQQASSENTVGRNDMVTITKDGEVQTLKYKKAEALLKSGWTLVA